MIALGATIISLQNTQYNIINYCLAVYGWQRHNRLPPNMVLANSDFWSESFRQFGDSYPCVWEVPELDVEMSELEDFSCKMIYIGSSKNVSCEIAERTLIKCVRNVLGD